MMTKFSDKRFVPDCVFCGELQDFGGSAFKNLTDWPYDSRTLFETETLQIIPGYAPQVFPYFLIISKRHAVGLPELNGQELLELERCVHWLASHPETHGRAVYFFEHGICDSHVRQSFPCVAHFHLHCILEPYDILTPFRELMNPREVDLFSESAVASLDSAYLLAGNMRAGRITSFTRDHLDARPSQYFRQLLASQLHSHAWRWQLGMNRPWILKAFEKFRALPGSRANYISDDSVARV